MPADPLRRLRTVPDPEATLVCLPHAGGGANSFRPLAAQPAFVGQEVLAVQYPGHADRLLEPMAESIEQLAAAAAEAVAAHRCRTGIPPVLLGHSMGASVAVETCARLEEFSLSPTLLVVAARRAPDHPDPPDTPVATRSDEDLVAELVGWGGTPAEALADAELRELILPVFRGDLELLERYRPRRQGLSTPLLVLWGDDDPTTPGEPMDWARLSSAPTRVRRFPGGHFFLHEQAPAVAAVLAAATASATRGLPAEHW